MSNPQIQSIRLCAYFQNGMGQFRGLEMSAIKLVSDLDSHLVLKFVHSLTDFRGSIYLNCFFYNYSKYVMTQNENVVHLNS